VAIEYLGSIVDRQAIQDGPQDWVWEKARVGAEVVVGDQNIEDNLPKVTFSVDAVHRVKLDPSRRSGETAGGGPPPADSSDSSDHAVGGARGSLADVRTLLEVLEAWRLVQIQALTTGLLAEVARLQQGGPQARGVHLARDRSGLGQGGGAGAGDEPGGRAERDSDCSSRAKSQKRQPRDQGPASEDVNWEHVRRSPVLG